MTLLPESLANRWVGGLRGRKPLDLKKPPHTKTDMHSRPQPVLRALQSPFWKYPVIGRIPAVSEVLSEVQDQDHRETARLYYFKQKLLLNKKHSQFQNMK